MTLEEALLYALRQGSGNPRQITERLEDRVRETLNRLAEDGKIFRSGIDGKGNEKTYSLVPPPKIPAVRRV